MRESTIEKALVTRIAAIGGVIRKVQWPGRRGAPDRVVMLPDHIAEIYGVPATVWVELKAPGKEPEPHQLREHQRMRAVGQCVLVIDNLEQINATFPANIFA